LPRKTVQVKPLTKVLAEQAVNQIDLLLVDAEDHDHEVLASLDFRLFRPKLIVVEHSSGESADAILRIMRESRYKLWYDNLQDFFFIPEEIDLPNLYWNFSEPFATFRPQLTLSEQIECDGGTRLSDERVSHSFRAFKLLWDRGLHQRAVDSLPTAELRNEVLALIESLKA
jgi:hypothetical protein